MEIKTVPLVLLLSGTWTILRAEIDGPKYENSVLVTSLESNALAEVFQHINLLPGTLYDLEGASLSYNYLGLNEMNTAFFSLDVDYARSVLYLYDRNTGAVLAVDHFNWEENFERMSLRPVHDGLSRGLVRLSVDWVTGNIYLTDPLFGWIIVQSGNAADTYKILVKDHIGKPVALAVSPVHKFLFWSDVGSTVKIERATLSGQNREAIISTGLAYPTSIDIDYTANKLVWVDSARDTIETANFDGTGRKIIRRMSHSNFFDVAVFRDMVGVTDLQNGSLVILNKNTGATLNSIRKPSGGPFIAVALYTSELQPSQDDQCVSKGCSDMCVHEDTGPVCLCKEGFTLNGLICSEDIGSLYRALMWSNSTSVCMTDVRSLTTNGHTDNTDCFFQDGTSITHFDLDMTERKVFFVDGQDIYTVNIEQNQVKQRLFSSNSAITGIAVDWRDNNVYWCTGTTSGQINVVSEDTLASYTLINDELTNPKDLAILPFHDAIVWISGNSGSYEIERSELAGSERHTVVSSGSLVDPKGLTVDQSTSELYYIDGGYVKRCNLDGSELTTLQPKAAFHSPMMVLTYKNQLIVADSDFPTSVLKVYEKKASEPVLKYQQTALNVDEMTDVKVLDAQLQPEQIGPCDILNGDCEHICIPIGRNRVCRCEYGFQLDSNKESCSSVPFTDYSLIVTDWTHNQMYQISLVSDDVVAIDTVTHGSPIGVIYNYKTQQVIWSTTELVHSIHLNGTGYRVLLNTEMLGCFADRFAIDYTRGNLYYSANLASLTGFVGIGVLSPDGLHKRLITLGLTHRPRAIVLDPEKGVLFWTHHGSSPAMYKANMDGSNQQTILQSGLIWPNGLAIDTLANLLYLTDGATDTIRRCSYAGACTTFHTDSGAHLMDVELLGDYLYYTAWNRPYVTKLDITNPSVVTRVGYKPELGRLDSVSLYSSAKTPSVVSSACLPNNGRGPCSTFCFPAPSSYSCGCEDGMSLLNDGKTCENARTTTVTTSTPSTTQSSTSTSTTQSSTSTSTTQSSTSTSTTQSTSPEQGGQTDTPSKLLVPVIAGASTGFVVLVVIIVIIVCILKRSRNKQRGRRDQPQQSHQYVTEFDISYISTPPVQAERPDSTYDLIKFDEPAGETEDNQQNDYMSLMGKGGVYETLDKIDKLSQNPRATAVPNDYHKMSDTSRPGSEQLGSDYLLPTPTSQLHVVDEDFDSAVYRGDPPVNNTNPFLSLENPVSTISYPQSK